MGSRSDKIIMIEVPNLGRSQPFPKLQILDSSKRKEVADDNFKFDENGRKFSKQVENIEGKEEIARYEQFLLSYSVFKRLVLQTRKSQDLFGKGLNIQIHSDVPVSSQCSLLPLVAIVVRISFMIAM